MEVEDEGHVGGQRSLAAGAVQRWKTRKERCTDLRGDAFEDNGIHPMLHRHGLYNNFNEENKALWEKINIMLENKNVVNRVSVFRKIVRLR